MSAEPSKKLIELARAFGGDRSMVGAADTAEPAITVEVATPERFLAVEAQWRDLAGRALAANAFMEPALVAAAAAWQRDPVYVLLAWAAPSGPPPMRLLGAWAFTACRASPLLPITVLKTPVHGHAALGTPVVDALRSLAVVDRLIAAIADAPQLPKLLQIHALHLSGPLGEVMRQVFLSRRIRGLLIDSRRRPRLDARVRPAPLSRSRSKALRQKRRRLAEQGEVCCTHAVHPVAFGAVLEEFLALEASGWKGQGARRGRAILRHRALSEFFRDALTALSARGLADIAVLRSAGRPVAMQVTLTSGQTAFTWKTAYDEAFKTCGPGLLLLEEVTALFSDDSRIESADSCNHRDDGYMAEFWSGRLDVADAVLDVRTGISAGFCLLGASAYLAFQAKHRARSVKAAWRAFPPLRRGLEALRRKLRDWRGGGKSSVVRGGEGGQAQ